MKRIIFLVIFVVLASIGFSKNNPVNETSSYELECLSCEIRDFTITNAGAGNATAIRNKVVAGREFNYRAINVSSRDINWELGEAPTWTINPVSPTTWDLNTNRRKSRGIGIVDNSIMPLSNSEFGATNGLVKIVDLHSGNDVCVDNVEVFFPKDEMNVNDPSVPNWFYYWTEEFKDDLTFTGMVMFNEMTGAWDSSPTYLKMTLNYLNIPWPGSTGVYTYGQNRWSVKGGTATVNTAAYGIFPNRLLVVGYDPNFTILDIALGCGYQKEILPNNSSTLVKGIDCFYTTWIHELEHVNIEFENWGGGFDQNEDSDGDGYRDSWEVMISNTTNYQFQVGVDDEYNPGNPPLTPPSVGYEYEEFRCRQKEQTVVGTVNEKDWSFDDGSNPAGLYQGKQW